MICIKPGKDTSLPKPFRQDGTYVCLMGKQPIKLHHEYREVFTNPNSYNMFRVINDDMIIMLGAYYANFYSKGQDDPIIQIGYTQRDHSRNQCDDITEPTPEQIFRNNDVQGLNYTIQVTNNEYNKDLVGPIFEIPLYEYLGLSCPEHPILTANEISKVPVDKFNIFRGEAFGPWDLSQQMSGVRYATAVKTLSEIDLSIWKIIDSTDLNWVVLETVEDNNSNDKLLGNISSVIVNNDYNLYGNSSEVHGILRHDDCPFIFIPLNINSDGYEFAMKQVSERWHIDSDPGLFKKLIKLFTYNGSV